MTEFSQLQHHERRFATLVESIKDYAIFMLSPEGTVLTWNHGAQRLKGYAPYEIIGCRSSSFTHLKLGRSVDRLVRSNFEWQGRRAFGRHSPGLALRSHRAGPRASAG